jgi:hypothetical protein
MPNDTTTRGYPLPHSDNVASEDVMRIREATLDIDTDIEALDDAQVILQEDLSRHLYEEFLNLWSTPYDHH